MRIACSVDECDSTNNADPNALPPGVTEDDVEMFKQAQDKAVEVLKEVGT